MSSLGLSLLILIVVAIGALAAYNFWLTRKPSAKSDDFDAGFSSSPATRQEPSFSSGATEPYLPDAGADLEATPVAASPPATSLAPSPVPAVEEPSATASEQPVKSDAMPEWAAGVLPAAPPPPPPPPDLNWQSGPTPEPKQAALPEAGSPFEASIEQAMRLQREADDLIGSTPDAAPADETTESQPLSKAPSESTERQSTTDSTADSATGPAATDEFAPAEPDRSAGNEAPAPKDATVSNPSEAPAQMPAEEPVAPTAAVGDFAAESVADGSATQNKEEPAQPPAAVQQQAELPAPGWSGIDADRQAANFVSTVNIELSAPTRGAELIARTRELTHAGTKPVRITAGNPPAPGQSVIRTEPINPDRDYALLRIEVLQVNRHGPLDGVEYSSFVAAVDAIGESLGVLVNPPDMNVVLIKSRVLDAEVASLDAQVAVNVETEDPIASEKFISLAEEIGLSKHDWNGQSGVYAANDDGGFPIYTAQLNAEATRIVLVLDVPAVPRELQPVRKMVEGAWAFAQALNGQMIDDNGRAIDNALFERIESQIETHYQALLAAGVPAGSDLARQVYNQV